ncbi:MAG: hypothetical protein IT286_05775 [Proteobacteria bacterium]|jgi:hypothetical protein|nr:hypothetical protein [Pseudomonadota bacterium]
MQKNLTQKQMIAALSALDVLLTVKVSILIGGGGAMILAHKFPLATSDIDAVAKGIELFELDPLVKKVAEQLSLPKDWLNPYFSTFGHVLPEDYGNRLIQVFLGKNIKAQALGKEDLLIMKCFAGRQKDIPHARALVKSGADIQLVEEHIRSLIQKRIPKADNAQEFLYEIEDWLGNQA